MFISTNKLRELPSGGMRIPFKSIKKLRNLSIFLQVLRTTLMLMGLRTTASKELVNNVLRQIGVVETSLVLLDLVVGCLKGFNIMLRLACLIELIYLWIVFRSGLVQLDLITQFIFTVASLIAGIIADIVAGIILGEQNKLRELCI